ncbi:Hemocyte protein-glutamine gamma-glutamyltransferase [Halotydeus destructor]|nr:Hemocyte protein-glutamine gamma-glutamyltransferase [Halotydeus destructor]
MTMSLKLIFASFLLTLVVCDEKVKVCYRDNDCAILSAIDVHLTGNSKQHNTYDYELSYQNLIIRRGQPFDLTIRHDGFSFAKYQARLSLTWSGEGIGHIIPLNVNASDFYKDIDGFSSKIISIDSDVVQFQVRTPVTAAVGFYAMKLEVKAKGQTEGTAVDLPDTFILFNPWCEDDQVYMPDPAMVEEYVLRDVGKVYQGSVDSPAGRKWIYGQFVEDILPAVVRLLAKSGLKEKDMGDLVKVTRAISSLVNANDGGGVIVGKWQTPYDDGRSPTEWSSSVPILRQYDQSGEGVRYGQCWVFAATATTVCRALGIPARPVTTFGSAHDTDDSLTIDTFIDEDGEEIKGFNSDSIWNFHVWTEVWFDRWDIPQVYSGWQAIDATPQERSEGIFQAGPGSVVAIRRGDVDNQYDLHFIFAETSSLAITWQRNANTSMGWSMVRATAKETGTMVATKRMGRTIDDYGTKDLSDITSSYKSPDEGEHRSSLVNAFRRAGVDVLLPGLAYLPAHDVIFELAKITNTDIGQPISTVLTARNVVNETIIVDEIVIKIDSRYYNGVPGNPIEEQRWRQITINPGQSMTFRLGANNYLDKLVEHSIVRVYAMAIVRKTNQVWAEDEYVQLAKPRLHLDLVGKANLGQEITVSATLSNPLNATLTGCVFTTEGHIRYLETPFRDILPFEKVKVNLSVYIDKVNYVDKIVYFKSNELRDVWGSIRVAVQ